MAVVMLAAVFVAMVMFFVAIFVVAMFGMVPVAVPMADPRLFIVVVIVSCDMIVAILGVGDGRADDCDRGDTPQNLEKVPVTCAGRGGAQTRNRDRKPQNNGYEFTIHHGLSFPLIGMACPSQAAL
ncbi:hypothetical protein [Roseovarius aestuarii]|nr:hypothetical protein [Roseovarius aestuarii]